MPGLPCSENRCPYCSEQKDLCVEAWERAGLSALVLPEGTGNRKLLSRWIELNWQASARSKCFSELKFLKKMSHWQEQLKEGNHTQWFCNNDMENFKQGCSSPGTPQARILFTRIRCWKFSMPFPTTFQTCLWGLSCWAHHLHWRGNVFLVTLQAASIASQLVRCIGFAGSRDLHCQPVFSFLLNKTGHVVSD